eukprot:scaffold6285_cov121-Isochrysis_galbana.AAC.26
MRSIDSGAKPSSRARLSTAADLRRLGAIRCALTCSRHSGKSSRAQQYAGLPQSEQPLVQLDVPALEHHARRPDLPDGLLPQRVVAVDHDGLERRRHSRQQRARRRAAQCAAHLVSVGQVPQLAGDWVVRGAARVPALHIAGANDTQPRLVARERLQAVARGGERPVALLGGWLRRAKDEQQPPDAAGQSVPHQVDE